MTDRSQEKMSERSLREIAEDIVTDHLRRENGPYGAKSYGVVDLIEQALAAERQKGEDWHKKSEMLGNALTTQTEALSKKIADLEQELSSIKSGEGHFCLGRAKWVKHGEILCSNCHAGSGAQKVVAALEQELAEAKNHDLNNVLNADLQVKELTAENERLKVQIERLESGFSIVARQMQERIKALESALRDFLIDAECWCITGTGEKHGPCGYCVARGMGLRPAGQAPKEPVMVTACCGNGWHWRTDHGDLCVCNKCGFACEVVEKPKEPAKTLIFYCQGEDCSNVAEAHYCEDCLPPVPKTYAGPEKEPTFPELTPERTQEILRELDEKQFREMINHLQDKLKAQEAVIEASRFLMTSFDDKGETVNIKKHLEGFDTLRDALNSLDRAKGGQP